MRPETAAALYDMSEAADRIVEATRDKTIDDYQRDWYFQSAVERQFEILGEALARIRDLERPIFEQFPEAARVVALRNIIIHGYDAVDPKVLWAIVEDRLPELRALLSRQLEEARRQGL